MKGLGSGPGLFLEGAAFLRRERPLWLLAAVPVVFAFLAVGGASLAFWWQLAWIHEAWTSLLPALEPGAWWSWLWVGPGRLLFGLIGILATVISFAVAILAALLLANLASAPFLDVLSQRIEAIVTGRALEDEGGSIVADTLRSFGAELQRVAFLAGLWLVISVGGLLIPGAQLLGGPLLVGVSIFFLPLDYAGFALDRRRLSFGERRRWLARHRATTLGFGATAFAACLVPGLNLVVLPVLVTAGTLLVLRTRPESLRAGSAACEAGDGPVPR